MGGQPVSRRGREKFFVFQQSTTAPSENVFRFSTTELGIGRFESSSFSFDSLTRVRQKQSHGAKLARAKPRFKL
jgi:hypothetical protein